MSEDRKKLIEQKGPGIYKKIAEKLRKNYPPTYFVAIEPSTGEYFVGKDFVEAGKAARKKYPRRTFFGAHVGWMTEKI
ncbi:MAG: hypothetical protein WCJ19_02640 [bacterium]